MLNRTRKAAMICATLFIAPPAFAADDGSKGGTPVSPSASEKTVGPTGKTGSSDPKAAGTPVAPSKSAQPGGGEKVH